jgi:hypothetical protein
VPRRGSAAGVAPVVRLQITAWPVVDTLPTTPTDGAEIAALPVMVIALPLDELTITLLRKRLRLALPFSVREASDGARTHNPQLPSGVLTMAA